MFDFSAVTSGIREADWEALAQKLSSADAVVMATRAGMADVDPASDLVVADDAEYNALLSTLRAWKSKVK